jgi:acetyltransferase-like isoleucine patch superfamily enzyme
MNKMFGGVGRLQAATNNKPTNAGQMRVATGEVYHRREARDNGSISPQRAGSHACRSREPSPRSHQTGTGRSNYSAAQVGRTLRRSVCATAFARRSAATPFDIDRPLTYRRVVGNTAKIPLLVRLIWKIERWRGRLALPTGHAVGGLLFYGRPLVENAWGTLMQAVIREPALRYRCAHVGKRLRMYGPTPRIIGDGIIEIGDDVEFPPDMVILVGLGMPLPARLHIGNDVRFGPGTMLHVARSVCIGDHFRTGPGVKIFDTDLHPTDADLRRQNYGTIEHAAAAPVTIEEDVWIGAAAIILKGVTLHRGAIVAAGAVVTRDVPPFTVVAGNPARVVRQLTGASTEA